MADVMASREIEPAVLRILSRSENAALALPAQQRTSVAGEQLQQGYVGPDDAGLVGVLTGRHGCDSADPSRFCRRCPGVAVEYSGKSPGGLAVGRWRKAAATTDPAAHT